MRGRVLGVLVTLAMLTSGAGTVFAQQQSGPNGLHLAYGENASSTVRVSWLGPPGMQARLDIREADEAEGEWERTIVATQQDPPGSAQTAYHAIADDLEAGTAYDYRVAIDGETSDTHTFHTAPEPSRDPNVTITAFADHGTVDPANSRADGDNPTRVTELAAKIEPTFHLHAGDTSYAEGDPRQWNEYFEQIEPLASKAPYMAVPGNHEREEPQGFQQYATRFNTATSEDGLWYSFQYANVLVVGLNSERACMAGTANEAALGNDEADDCETGEAVEPYPPQLSFVNETLSEAAEDPSIDWRIVLTHHLFFSSSAHAGAIGLKDHYMPLVDRYNVDVVVQGHDHVYERSKTLHDGQITTNGTVYLTNGAAGSGTYGFSEDKPTWSAYRDNEHYGVLVLDIQGETLEGRFETLSDGAIDEFTLTNVDDGPVRYTDANTSRVGGDDVARVDETPAPGLVALLAAAGVALLARRRR